MPLFHHHHKSHKAEHTEADQSSRQLVHSDTVASTSSSNSGTSSSLPRTDTVTSSTSSTESKQSKMHSLAHTLTGTGYYHNSKEFDPNPFILPRDPVALVQKAVEVLFTVGQGEVPIDRLFNEIIPQLYHDAYAHRVNCRETGIEGLKEVVTFFRTRFRVGRLPIVAHLSFLRQS